MGAQVGSSQGNSVNRNWLYGGICAVATVMFLLLYSSGNGEYLNTTLVTYSGDTYGASGISTLSDSTSGWVINDDASFFVHMPVVVQFILTYAIFGLLALAVFDGISRRSSALAFAPAVAALIVPLFVRTDFTLFDGVITIVAAALMCIALGATLRRHMFLATGRRRNVEDEAAGLSASDSESGIAGTPRGRVHT